MLKCVIRTDVRRHACFCSLCRLPRTPSLRGRSVHVVLVQRALYLDVHSAPQTYITSDSSYPPQNRTYIDSHGVRLNIVQSGAIGVFDVMVGGAILLAFSPQCMNPMLPKLLAP